MRAPAFAMATGKAMLAHEPDEALDRFRPLFKRFTATTRVTPEELMADIRQIRQQGYAMVLQGEWRDGIAACACAVLGRAGEVAGAIGISGPDSVSYTHLDVYKRQFFAFLHSFDELLLSLFLSSAQLKTLPLMLWADINYQLNPVLAVVSSLEVLLVVICLLYTSRCV